MLIPGILGFQSLVYIFLLVAFLVIRHMWRNAEARKEEIIRLVDMVSEDSAMAEIQASAEYSSVPAARWYQCAICHSSTTMRCSQCKAVRYCSGKCQIIHWRQGHKDECYPQTTMPFREESNSDIKGTHAGIASSSNSYSSFDPSVAARKSFDNDSHIRLAKPVSDNIVDDTCAAASHANETLTTSVPLASKNSVHNEVKSSSASKKNKTNSYYTADEIDLKSKLPKPKVDTSLDAAENLGGHEHRRKVPTGEKSVTDASRRRPSVHRSGSDSIIDGVEEDIHISKYKEVRKSSASASDRLSSITKGDLLPDSKYANSDSYHAFPAKVGGIPDLPQNIRNGFKTSVQKVVQQFRSSKGSNCVENEMGFPFKLFMELYSYDKVELFPFGLINCGNSCYANAVLQCLAYTRPLTSYLLQGLHTKHCQKKGWCFICEFECLIQKGKEGNSPLSPIGILSKIHKIGSHLGHGREEDAHEFLRCAVDTMQSICLKEAGVITPLTEETTLIGYTFGGYLRSKIKCLRCLGKSERYERMMDLSVEIDGDIGTLEEALGQFTAPEILEKNNKYNCNRCKSYEKARKKLTVLEAPNILTVVLKRFQSGNFEKLNKSVQFPEVLNMAPFMSGTKDKSPVYSLYAVVVHLDVMNAAYSGHYVCYVKNFRGEWFRIDDSRVEPVELSRVLSERAYMLLYARHSPKSPGSVYSTAISSVGKLRRRSSEAIHATSKTRSNSTATSIDPSTLRQKHGKNPHRNVIDGPLSNEFLHPEEWSFHYGERNAMVDSFSESSSLFSSSDASSCSTASTKDSSSTADFSDYIFGEMGPDWYSHYGLSSDTVESSSYESFGTDSLIDSDGTRRFRQGSELEDNAVLYANRNKNHSGSRGTDLKKYVSANHYDKNSGVHVRRTSRDASAQTFY
ncbi:hypothetical protein L6164_020522 [Bauhinia variegata]|uniref:Uncharacterized protein n=1 Tax=Bauhinia variegata TaxID=167791 RepID=A0ACB9MW60_BAUVA|nr:hypothetical protein L6164_020522 [Bauhinia variegata]